MLSLNRNIITGLSASICFVVLSSNTFAYMQDNVSEFSFLIQSNDLSLKYDDPVNSVIRTKVSSLRATWWQALTKQLQGGLSLAYVDMTQNSYSNVPAYNSTGYNIGIGLRGAILQTNFVNIGLGVTADYLSTTGGTAFNNKTDVSWAEYVGSADFVFIPTKPVSILGGVSYTVIDGTQKIYGTFNRTLSFSANTPEGYYGGLSIKTGGTGRINMTWHEGTRQGFYLTFSNQF